MYWSLDRLKYIEHRSIADSQATTPYGILLLDWDAKLYGIIGARLMPRLPWTDITRDVPPSLTPQAQQYFLGY